MEAPEVPLEHSQEHIKEHAEKSGEKWILGVALSTAVLAAIAAIASLLAGQDINEGMISQMRASDQWAYYQAKGIKAGIVESKIDLIKSQGKEPSAEDLAKVAKYSKEQEDISTEARKLEKESNQQIKRHEGLASSVTFFQIAIAVSAIAALTKKRLFWYVGLGFGCVGVAFLAMALMVKL